MTIDEGSDLLMSDALITGDASGAIERQEARVQSALVHSDLLPTDRRTPDAAWEALGFTFGEPVEGDPMFCHATLPEGWSRKGSSHAMWSYIYDGDGFKRVSIFYKAAWYDRSANASIERVPTTDAQDATLERIYNEFPPYKSGEANWSTKGRESRSDRAVVAAYALAKVNRHPEPEEIYARRVVVILPDGSIESDVTERVTA